MGHHKTFNDETHIPQSVLKRAKLVATLCAVIGLGASFGGYFTSHDTHVMSEAHADHHETATHGEAAHADKAHADHGAAHADQAHADHGAAHADHGAAHGHEGGHGEVSTKKQFFFSWLTAFAFFTTLCLGGLFFTILHHLVRASWSTGLRRIAENLAMNIPIMAVCALVFLLGFDDVYSWTKIKVSEDPFFAVKEPYLNTNFFTIRAVFFFAVWILMALFFRSNSVKQDGTDGGDAARALNFKMRKLAPLSMLTFALTLTFFAFDWLMSLDPHWFSTMFGVYIFAGTVVALFSTLIVSTLWLEGNGVLKNTLTIGNFHDAGKLLFGFIVFWTYITFCQYYLIWYANIPEETGWYLRRMVGGWENIGLLIAVGHFIMPFWLIMSRHVKRNRTVLGFAAIWMLIMHFVDLYFVVMPTLHGSLHFHWMDVTTFIGIGGVFLHGFLFWSGKDAIVAHKDPQLIASMEYDNV